MYMLKRVFLFFLALVMVVPALAQDDDWESTDVSSVVQQIQQQEAQAAQQGAQPSPQQDAQPAQVQDDWDSPEQPAPGSSAAVATEQGGPQALPEVASSSSAVVPQSSSELVVVREVPVRYWNMADDSEMEAIFVKIQRDTVYLRHPNADDQKRLEKMADEAAAELQRSNDQEVPEEDDDSDEPVKRDTAEIIMTDAVKDAVAAQADTAAPVQAEPVDDGADDDFETALEKEDTRMKLVEIAKVEEEIRQQEIQDSLAADSANPYIKIFRLDLKRLYNLEDDVMIDLSLSNYVVPEIEEEEEDAIELYPAGNANLVVYSSPMACSLFVNGIPINQIAPDTIRNIRPGKYTISVMQVLKGVEWWGTQVVRIDADSVNKVSIAVQRPTTRLTLNTDPEAVEVYIDKEPDVNHMPHYMTDVMLDNLRPQPKVSLYFRKVGYRDTTIVTEIKAFMPNLINVEMEPVLDDLDFIEEQNEFNRERSQRRIGRGLLWSSIAPIVAAGVLWYFAEQDWKSAADKKHAYGLSAFESPDTDKMVKDNHDLNRKGDIKCGIAAGLGAIGIGLLTAGFILAF